NSFTRPDHITLLAGPELDLSGADLGPVVVHLLVVEGEHLVDRFRILGGVRTNVGADVALCCQCLATECGADGCPLLPDVACDLRDGLTLRSRRRRCRQIHCQDHQACDYYSFLHLHLSLSLSFSFKAKLGGYSASVGVAS